MHTLGEVVDRYPPLPADGLCEVALAVFVRNETCRVLAVVDDGRAVGLVQRESFLIRMEAPGGPERPLSELMEPAPVSAEAREPLRQFVQRIAVTHPAALHAGVAVTEAGSYIGVADPVRMVAFLASDQVGASPVERFCAEIREPIADALAAAEGLLRMRLPDGAPALVDTIREAGGSALDLLDIAVELQKAEAGRLEIVPTSVRLQELMDEIDRRWRPRAEEAAVTLLVSYDGQPDCAAMADRERLLQVFDVLIGRAMACAGRGVIEASLRAQPTENGVALVGRVRDNGTADPGDDLASMLSWDSDGGAGGRARLGLMLAERTMSALAGRLQAAANTGPGATITFEFTAPAAVEAAAAEVAPTLSARPARAAHILVVDDNATNRMVVEALCEMFDCSTESVADGQEAVEAAKAGRFDLILMDIKMPKMDGVTAAREIRRLAAPASRVPIIALTANADPDEVGAYLAAGMCSVVEKPIKAERLREALEAALGGGAHAGAAAA
ncbi:MAG: response regulator [Caulobacteraceae bacterium]|nr:response regulator [Caulobacteraceae bacterium]